MPTPTTSLAVRAVLLLLSIGLPCTLQAKPTAPKQNYYVAGWSTLPAATFVKRYTPALQTYLTEEVGPLYDPPITFTLLPFFYDEATKDSEMIKAGKLDFAYHLGGTLVCLQAQYGYTIMNTQVQAVLGREISMYGSAIFSSEANMNIRDMSDFRGKRLGVGFPWALTSYLLGSEFLDASGLKIYTEFSQVVWYLTDYVGMANGVVNGEIDVAIMQGGWLEANYPAVIPQLRYHHLLNASYHGEPYPFKTSTIVVPSYGMAAAPHIPATLQRQVFEALRKLNSSHPASKAASIANFMMPACYEDSRRSVERLGLMYTTPEGGKACGDLFMGLDAIVSCPAGYGLLEREGILSSCATKGLPCPANRTCFCRPCYANAVVNVFPWRVVVGLCGALFAVGFCFRAGWIGFLQGGGVT